MQVMTEKPVEIVIPREKAVFWLDKNGCWRNKHGKFEHKKIIDFFHMSIRKDEAGYYLFQTRDNYREKVYFRHEDTALFVFSVKKDREITLLLNTGKQFVLVPEDLFVKNDSLYVNIGDEQAKFTEQSLMKVSDMLEVVDGDYFIRVKDDLLKLKELGA
jgi:hypothetical protein